MKSHVWVKMTKVGVIVQQHNAMLTQYISSYMYVPPPDDQDHNPNSYNQDKHNHSPSNSCHQAEVKGRLKIRVTRRVRASE